MAQTQLSAQSVKLAAKRLGRPVDDAQAALLTTYVEHLIKWNKKMNLVGKSGWGKVFDTLIVDSLFLADFLAGLKLPDQPLCLDFGAGAGLPGIPLRVLWRQGDYWLVEIREKRVLFMRSALGRMQLPGIHVFHGKAEEALGRLEAAGKSATADLVLSRAFMPWPKLLDFVQPMLSEKGMLVVLSNDAPPAENDLPQAWTLADVASYPVAGDQRYFWSLRLAAGK